MLKQLTDKQREIAEEAYHRATSSDRMSNYGAVYAGFEAMGIDANEIIPRENVLTYHAWRAKGRQVKRGEHGVKITTWIPIVPKADKGAGTKEVRLAMRPKTAVVFHVSQTEPMEQ